MRLMVWAPSGDQSKDKGEWLQTCCKKFAEQHPEYDIDFVYGVADEATAADSVTQDAEASADVFMFANDNITKLTNAKAAVKFGGGHLCGRDYKDQFGCGYGFRAGGRIYLRGAVYNEYLVYVL